MLDIEQYLLQIASQKEQATALAMASAVCEGKEMSEKLAGLPDGSGEVHRELRWEQVKAAHERLVQHRIN
jgi:hypothetical protein